MDWIKTSGSSYMLFIRNSLNLQQRFLKGCEIINHENAQRKSEVTVLISDKIHFKTRNSTRNWDIMMKSLIAKTQQS